MSRLDAVWSSKSDEWSTPKELFDELNAEQIQDTFTTIFYTEPKSDS